MNAYPVNATPLGKSRKLTFMSALMIAALTIGLASCSSSPPKETEHVATVSDSSTMGTPFDTTRVTAAIDGIGTSSEDLYDLAKAKDWVKAAAGVASLKTFSQQLNEARSDPKQQQDRLNESIAALDLAVSGKDRLAAMREANAATLVGVDLAGEFSPTVPADVARLDYYGRELEIGSETGDLASLQQAADGARRAWAAVAPAVEAHGGMAEARKFSELMTQTQSAKTPADFGKLALPILEEVDNLERVFEKK